VGAGGNDIKGTVSSSLITPPEKTASYVPAYLHYASGNCERARARARVHSILVKAVIALLDPQRLPSPLSLSLSRSLFLRVLHLQQLKPFGSRGSRRASRFITDRSRVIARAVRFRA
jgi:hypothetical protein